MYLKSGKSYAEEEKVECELYNFFGVKFQRK